jgi:hypothetical protein
VHPVAEVRGRTLQSLEFKWKYGLLGADDLLADRRVLAALLRECRLTTRVLALGEGPAAADDVLGGGR